MSKTAQAAQALKDGDLKTCLKLVSGFRLGVSREQARVLKTGYECMVHPRMYAQLVPDIQSAISAAKIVAISVLSKECKC